MREGVEIASDASAIAASATFGTIGLSWSFLAPYVEWLLTRLAIYLGCVQVVLRPRSSRG